MRSLRFALRLFTPVRARLLAAAGLGALAYVSAIGLIAVSGWLISRASQMPPVLTLGVAIVMVRAFGLGRAVFRYAERFVSHDAVLRSLVDVRVALYQSLVNIPVAQLVRMRRADTFSTLVRDVDEVQYLPLRGVVPAVGATFASLVCITAGFWLDIQVGLWLLAGWLLCATAVPWLSWSTANRVTRESADDAAEISAACVDLIDGSADIAALGLSGQAMAHVAEVDARITTTALRFTFRSASANLLVGLIQGAMVVGSAWSAVRAIDSGGLNPVMLATAVFIPMAMTEVLAVYAAAALTLTSVEPSAERLAGLLQHRDDMKPSDDGYAHWRSAGSHVAVARNEHLGLVGPSGSGKSTTLAQMLGLIDRPQSAAVAEYAEPLLAQIGCRGHLVAALAEQRPQVFATSIAENLQLARPPQESPLPAARLWEALEAVDLDGWVRGLPAGLDSMVGVGGAKMSGGQRQRLSLARLFIADPDMWLVDEPTAHLDDAAAEHVIESLRRATSNRTLIVASHDQRDLSLCIRVVRLAD